MCGRCGVRAEVWRWLRSSSSSPGRSSFGKSVCGPGEPSGWPGPSEGWSRLRETPPQWRLPATGPSGTVARGVATEPDRPVRGAGAVLLFGGTSRMARRRTTERFGGRSTLVGAGTSSWRTDFGRFGFDERGERCGAHRRPGASAPVVMLLGARWTLRRTPRTHRFGEGSGPVGIGRALRSASAVGVSASSGSRELERR